MVISLRSTLALAGALAGALAACQDAEAPNGVLLAIRAPADVDIAEVQVYVGLGGGRLARIAPEGVPLAAAPVGTAYVRDQAVTEDVLALAPGGTARFVLATGSAPVLDAVIAVGRRRDGTITAAGALADVRVSGTDLVVHPLELAAARDLTDPPDPQAPATQPRRARTWGRGASCVVYQDPAANETAFVVTDAADPDCDGYQEAGDGECVPEVFDGRRPAEDAELACAVQPLAGTCVLGGPPCIDGAARDPSACEPSPFCVPAPLCGACSNGGDLWACLLAPPLGTVQYGAVKCDLPYEELADGQIPLAGASANTVVLDATLGTGVTCARVTMRDPADGTWDTSLELPYARFDLEVEAPCEIRLVVEAGAPIAVIPTITTLLAIELAAPGQRLRHLVMPLWLEPSSTVIPQPLCRREGARVIDAPLMRACLGLPPL